MRPRGDLCSVRAHNFEYMPIVFLRSRSANVWPDQYCEPNLLVYSSFAGPGSASPPIKFLLTRNQHLKHRNVKPTLTAIFKDPPEGLIGEAWRILLEATDSKQLRLEAPAGGDLLQVAAER